MVSLPGPASGQRGQPAQPRDPMQEGLQLRPTRTASWTTKVGNWISLDVSPDGRTIAFDVLGDLYTMPITGGKATPLTRGMAFDGQPRFSPDGKKIAFVSDRDGGWNLWTISLDKRDTTQVTRGKQNNYESPEWTPDGKYVIAERGTKLWMFHVEGGSGQQLIPAAVAAAGGRGGAGGADVLRQMGAAFGPDPRYVWFEQRRGSWIYNTPMSDYDIAVLDRETGEVTSKENRWGSAFRPTLSPDGRWLVYGTRHIRDTYLRIRDLKTGDDRWFVGPVQRDDLESRASLDVLPGMSFTPDSKFLLTTWQGKIWKVAVENSAITEVPFEADVVQALGPNVHHDYPISDSATFIVKQIRDAVPSPDGRRLAFVALDHLYTMDYPGGAPKRLTSSAEGEFQPAWSPDGSWITYTTFPGKEGGNLYRMRADGSGQPQKLTNENAFWQKPVYSPNGSRILALRGPARLFGDLSAGGGGGGGGQNEIVWLPAGGGAATLIAESNGLNNPHFARGDSTRIYAYGGQRGLVSMRWDGTDVKTHLRVAKAAAPGGDGGGGGRGGGASWVQISPTGDQALAQAGNDVYLVSMPWVGAEAPTVTVGEAVGNFPMRKLSDIGAQFPAWGADGKSVHWSIGNAHVVYDVDRGRAFDDSVRRVRGAPADSAGGGGGGGGRGGRGGGAPAPMFQPAETRIRISAPRDIPSGSVVLRGARIVSMKGTEVIEGGDVVVTNNRIVGVGKRGSVRIPAGAKVMDMSGKTIVPGFVDTHSHFRAAGGVHRDPVWSYVANLAYGVTTGRDPQTGTTDVLSYEDQVVAGNILGPRIYSTGPGLFGAGNANGENIRDLAHARNVLRRYAEYYDTKTLKEYGTGNREQRQWVIQAANELKLMPTTEGSLDIKMNITEMIDGYSGHEHTIPTFPLQADVIKLLAESGIAYTPTIIVAYGAPWAENYWFEKMDLLNDTKLKTVTPWSDLEGKILRRGGSPGAVTTGASAGWFHDSQYAMDLIGADIKNLVAAGGRTGVGSHGQLQGLGYHWELWSIAMGGMTTHDALRVATIIGADALGLAKDLGSLEAGKLADLVVLDKNPLQNIQNTNSIKYVMKNGRLYDGNSLDEVYPRVKKAGPFPWNEPMPANTTKQK